MSQESRVLKCGHAPNAVRGKDTPCCSVCGCVEFDEKIPNLTGRKSRCCYGNHDEQPSNVNLAFFRHTPERDHDTHYCGCFGWD